MTKPTVQYTISALMAADAKPLVCSTFDLGTVERMTALLTKLGFHDIKTTEEPYTP